MRPVPGRFDILREIERLDPEPRGYRISELGPLPRLVAAERRRAGVNHAG